MEAVRSCEKLENYRTTQRHIPEGTTLQSHHFENLKPDTAVSCQVFTTVSIPAVVCWTVMPTFGRKMLLSL
jgi:hypothetical protein